MECAGGEEKYKCTVMQFAMGTRVLQIEPWIALQILFRRILGKEKEKAFKSIAEERVKSKKDGLPSDFCDLKIQFQF